MCVTCFICIIFFFFFFNDTATTEIYTLHIVGSVRCVQETGIIAVTLMPSLKIDQHFKRNKYLVKEINKQNKIKKQVKQQQFCTFILCIKSHELQQQILFPRLIQLKKKIELQQQKKIEHFIYKLSLIHISEPTRLGMISYAVFCLKKKKKKKKKIIITVRLMLLTQDSQ
eukprot:TRINITY_DN1392_c0_g1_i2.p1 TRINITY_DN1392_c0_g1~~TRINITY_DN1392_c0_g1_i2.p1  ORF type:complete len:170 (+),score=55.30 TRINITY_DN1392_c0_g1_i2:97-606(+)